MIYTAISYHISYAVSCSVASLYRVAVDLCMDGNQFGSLAHNCLLSVDDRRRATMMIFS